MTIFGPDIYHGQAGLDLSRLKFASFIIAKTTEGTYYVDKSYQAWRQQAQAAGKPFIWYHFLTRENVQEQVKNTAANVGDISLPGMLDVEEAYDYSPTLQQVLDYIDAAHAADLNLRLIYLPHWYWQQIGSPGLGQIAARGVHLVNSSYPGGAGTPAQIYPGDEYPAWAAFGGVPVELYQFTDQALDGGMRMDYNAYHGTVDDLRRLLYGSNPITPQPQGDSEVELTDKITVSDGFAARYPDVANPVDGFTAGAQIPVSVLLEGAALRAVNNEKLLNKILAKVGGGVDEAKLAADLGALIHPTTDVNALATALEQHQVVQDAKAFADALTPHIQVKVESQ